MMTTQSIAPEQGRMAQGAMWHPQRGQLIWYDAAGMRLCAGHETVEDSWALSRPVGGIGVIDRDHLMLAASSGLLLLDMASGRVQRLREIERRNPLSNVVLAQADPWGGFWVGTAGLNWEDGVGSIYRLHEQDMRVIVHRITRIGGICFDPEHRYMYYADSDIGKVWRVGLDRDGWPTSAARIFLDLGNQPWGIAALAADQDGALWVAQSDGSIRRYDHKGTLLSIISIPTLEIRSMTFGGDDLDTLYIGSRGMSGDTVVRLPQSVRGCPVARVTMPRDPEPGLDQARA